VPDGETEGTQQVRIVDASGHACRAIRDHTIQTVALRNVIGAAEPELIVWTLQGGNGSFCNEFAFTQEEGIKNIFKIDNATKVEIKSFDSNLQAEVVTYFRLNSVDGSGTHHFPQLASVYKADDIQFSNVTAHDAQPALQLADEYKQAIEKRRLDKSDTDNSEFPDAIDDAIGYVTNMTIIDRGSEAVAWLKTHAPASTLKWFSNPQNIGEIRNELQDAMKPLPTSEDTVLGASAEDGPPLKDEDKIILAKRSVASSLIIPGESSGNIRLGMTQSVVQSLLGKPTTSVLLQNGVVEDYWADKSQMRADVLYVNGYCIQAELMDPILCSRNKISTGSPIGMFFQNHKDAVLKVYEYDLNMKALRGEAAQLPYMTPGEVDIYFYDSLRNGIAVEIATQDQFTLNDKPGGIIVHRPGHPIIIPTYGVFNHTPHLHQGDRELQPPYIYDHLSSKLF